MSILAAHFPLVKLPHKIDYCLFLIKEELKSKRFFEGLHSVGLEDVYLQPHLDKLILKSVGLEDGTDETSEFISKSWNAEVKRSVPTMIQSLRKHSKFTWN